MRMLDGARCHACRREGLDTLAAVLPDLDSAVILAGHAHLATQRAPGPVAAVMTSLPGRVLRSDAYAAASHLSLVYPVVDVPRRSGGSHAPTGPAPGQGGAADRHRRM